MSKHYNQGKNNPMYGKRGEESPTFGLNRFGKNAPAYKDGRTLKNYYCIDCGIKVSTYKTKRCQKCASKGRKPPLHYGKNHPSWKGGRYKNDAGYVFILKSNHPFCNNQGYVREHRLVIEKQIGRYLHRWEVSHHINKIRDDNRPKNLMAFKSCKIHNKFEKNYPISSKDIIFNGSKK